MLIWLLGLPAVGKTIFTQQVSRERLAVVDTRFWQSPREQTVRSILDFGDSRAAIERYLRHKSELGARLAEQYLCELAEMSRDRATLIETTPFLFQGMRAVVDAHAAIVIRVGVSIDTHGEWLGWRFRCTPSYALRMTRAYARAARTIAFEPYDHYLDQPEDRRALRSRLEALAVASAPATARGTLLLGPTGSGKSSKAEGMLLERRVPLAYFGTLPGSPRWTEKVRRHRARRDARWVLGEATGQVAADLATVRRLLETGRPLLLDGLSMWVHQTLAHGSEAVDALYQGLGVALRSARADWIVVDPRWQDHASSGAAFADVMHRFHDMLVAECRARPMNAARGAHADG